METFFQDLRYGVRTLLKKPGFALIAVVTLALGIGAITSIFSVVNSVLLNPLPYKDSDRLVELREFKLPQSPDSTVSPGNFIEWRKQQTVFEYIEAHRSDSYDLTEVGEPERISAERVTAGMFDMLGVSPARGRSFSVEEDQPGNEQVAILSHQLWQRRFNSDPDILNRTITLNGRAYTVIGIMPSAFVFPNRRTEIWTPMAFTPRDAQNYGGHYISAMARLHSGATMEQASAEMSAVAGRLAEMVPGYNEGNSIRVIPLLDYTVRQIKPALLMLFGAVALVLLIVSVNVANLQLSRSAARQKEMAIRAALGANRFRVIRQLLTESIMLSLTGGALGLLLAFWGVDGLVALSAGAIPRTQEIGIDYRALGFTFAVSALTGILFGLAPALQASKPNLNEALKEGSRSATSDSRLFGLRNLLVIAEVALSLMLLVGAGLLVRSFIRLLNVDPGFNSQNVLTMSISLPREKYTQPQQISAFYEQLLQRVERVHGVESAALISLLPLEQRNYIFSFTVENESSEEDKYANLRWASPGYFRALGIPLRSGREFTERDRQGAPGSLIINQALANRYFPDQNPIGKRINIPIGEGFDGEIIGVIADIKHFLNSDPRPEMYVSYLQAPTNNLILAARTSVDPSSVTSAIRAEVLAIDPERPVSNVRTMEQLLSESVADRRFNMGLLVIFAALALVLAAIGIYGVMSYTVTQSTREIGIRIALGAQRSDVLKLVVGRGLAMTSIGVAAGAAAALALTRLIARFLFGVTATDPMTFIVVSMALALVALLSCYIPARRATRVDPMVALRYE